MTEEDRLSELGRMVHERQEIKSTLACLENKARRIEVTLERAQTAVRQSHVLNWEIDPKTGNLILSEPDYGHGQNRSNVEEPGPYPTLEEIREYLTDRKRLKDRLEELNRLLSI